LTSGYTHPIRRRQTPLGQIFARTGPEAMTTILLTTLASLLLVFLLFINIKIPPCPNPSPVQINGQNSESRPKAGFFIEILEINIEILKSAIDNHKN